MRFFKPNPRTCDLDAAGGQVGARSMGGQCEQAVSSEHKRVSARNGACEQLLLASSRQPGSVLMEK
jgi:hypothetical protein